VDGNTKDVYRAPVRQEIAASSMAPNRKTAHGVTTKPSMEKIPVKPRAF